MTEIDCYFDEGEPTHSDILEQQLIENCLREDLQPIEEAEAFASLIKLNGWTGDPFVGRGISGWTLRSPGFGRKD